jgi:hypothetical protein
VGSTPSNTGTPSEQQAEVGPRARFRAAPVFDDNTSGGGSQHAEDWCSQQWSVMAIPFKLK